MPWCRPPAAREEPAVRCSRPAIGPGRTRRCQWEPEVDVCERVERQLRSVADALAWRVFAYDRRVIVALSRNDGVPIQEISDTVGHKSTHVTETVYRHVIVPEIRGGATVMDAIFDDNDG